MNRNPSGLEIAALIIGIISIPMACYHATLGLIAAVIGIVLSVKARRYTNSGIAMAGFVCSIVGCAFGAINLLLAFILVLFAVAL